MMSVLFILNPVAGKGRALQFWEKWGGGFLSAFPASQVWKTQEPGSAAAMTRKALAQGFSRILAVGGDGTFGGMVDGFLSSTSIMRMKTFLGCVPVGTGCDFARCLGIPSEPARLVEMIKRGRSTVIDGGRAVVTGAEGESRERFFVTAASFGLGAEVLAEMDKESLKGRRASYRSTALKCLRSARAREVAVEIDGRRIPEGRLHLGVVANSSMFGGGMKIAPPADMSDGKLDFVAVGDVGRVRLFLNFFRVYLGTHLKVKGVSHRKALRVDISSPTEMKVNIDGDLFGRLPAHFEIVPRRLPVLIP